MHRAKTIDLLQTNNLTQSQLDNTKLNIQEMLAGKSSLLSYPQRIVLELTNACNLSCIMCGRNATDFIKTWFDLAWLDKLKNALLNIEEVTLFGWGEPTIHPKFVEIIKYLHDFPVRKYFVTNGTTLAKFKDIIFDYCIDIIAISMDGASPEINNRIRRGADFNKIISNIAEIVKERKKRAVNYPYMNFVFTAMRSNLHELPNMIYLAKDLGIEEVKVVYLTVFSEDLAEESLWGYGEEIKKIFQETLANAKKLDIKVKLPQLIGEDEAGEKNHRDCFNFWRDFFIGSDGFVRPCQSSAEKCFHIASDLSFEDMWNSLEFQNFRKTVNDEKLMPKECSRCFQSSHANWNKKHAFVQIGEKFAPEWEK
jgi:radical SAM protein with 4Fe4S-binding SPASM domain